MFLVGVGLKMKYYFHLSIFVFCISFMVWTEARLHRHTEHKHSHKKLSYISQPPSAPPEPAPNPPRVLDVRDFGAVGDGKSDDTEAFKMAWDTACQSESAPVICAPNGFSFMIQSTIFTGPCQSGIVFEVILQI